MAPHGPAPSTATQLPQTPRTPEPLHQFSKPFLLHISHSPWAKDRPPQADRPLFVVTIWRVRSLGEEPPLHYKTHAAQSENHHSNCFRTGKHASRRSARLSIPESAVPHTFERFPSSPETRSSIACPDLPAFHARQTQSSIHVPRCPAFHTPAPPETARWAAPEAQTVYRPPECRRRTLPVAKERFARREFLGIFFQATGHKQTRIVPRRFSRHRLLPLRALGWTERVRLLVRNDTQLQDVVRLLLRLSLRAAPSARHSLVQRCHSGCLRARFADNVSAAPCGPSLRTPRRIALALRWSAATARHRHRPSKAHRFQEKAVAASPRKAPSTAPANASTTAYTVHPRHSPFE